MRWLWAVASPAELPLRVHKILAAEEITASVVSYWELVLKKGARNCARAAARGLVGTLCHRLRSRGPACAGSSHRSTRSFTEWHRDPFDHIAGRASPSLLRGAKIALPKQPDSARGNFAGYYIVSFVVRLARWGGRQPPLTRQPPPRGARY
jgi:PIN domain nuclease of toxin-antitoxin system